MPVVLGIDAGLSCVKAAAFDETGRVLGIAERANSAVRHRGAACEADMPALWELVVDAVAEVLAGLEGGTAVEAVGVCGHGNGVYLIDDDDRPIRAVTSMDTRAQPLVNQWAADGRAAAIRDAVGGAVWTGQPLPILAHFGLPAGARLLFCKDWIRLRLTGRAATDLTDASAGGLIDLSARAWSSAALEIAGLDNLRDGLAELAESFQPVGAVTPSAAERTGLPAGAPVAAGGIDLAMGAFGDALPVGRMLHVTAGTWAIHQLRTAEPTDCPEILQTLCSPFDGREALLVESSPTCAANLPELCRRLGVERPDFRRWESWVAAAPLDDDLIYLPYPSGAWDLPDVRATFVPDRPDQADDAVVRAVYEGIVLGHRRQIDKYRRAGMDVGRLRVTGGLTRSDAWCQLLCDATRLPVEAGDNPHAACWGAAICALRAVGREPAAAPPARKCYDPRGDRADRLEARYAAFSRALESFGKENRWT